MPGIESRLNGVWYGNEAPPLLLRILSRAYRQALRWRRPLNTGSLRVPVIVIGNFTVGGTGKTPLIIAVVEHLKRLGLKPGVISRGYGRSSRSAYALHDGSTAGQSGDEPLLIYRRTQAPVQVDSDRLAAARHLIGAGCDVIVSDDGLQHRNLPRQIEIEVYDAARGYGNGRLLPAGPLREFPRPVDMRVGNGLDADTASEYRMQLRLAYGVRLLDGARRRLSEFGAEAVHAVAGIGNPSRFFKALEAQGIRIIAHPFPDHHRFEPSDLPSGTVLMTEKDAVKCAGLGRADLWAVPAEAELSDVFFRDLEQRLERAGEAHD
jgi:tetraacyldisaccharide 4'-kinase